MKNIVTLAKGSSHKEDRSWACRTKGEAERMVQWLKDNHIEADAYSIPEWNILPERNDQ